MLPKVGRDGGSGGWMVDKINGEAGGHWSSPDHSGLAPTEVKRESSFVIHTVNRPVFICTSGCSPPRPVQLIPYVKSSLFQCLVCFLLSLTRP